MHEQSLEPSRSARSGREIDSRNALRRGLSEGEASNREMARGPSQRGGYAMGGGCMVRGVVGFVWDAEV